MIIDHNGDEYGEVDIETFTVQYAFSDVDPLSVCPTTSFDKPPIDLSPTSHSISSDSMSVPFTPKVDYWSRLYNDDAFCSPRLTEFKFSGTPTTVPFLSMSPSNTAVLVQTTDIVDIGSHEVEIHTSMPSYTGVTEQVSIWNVEITCPIDNSLLPPPSVTITKHMPQTSFTYKATNSTEAVVGELALAQSDIDCTSLSQSYIIEATSGNVVDYIKADPVTATFSLFT